MAASASVAEPTVLALGTLDYSTKIRTRRQFILNKSSHLGPALGVNQFTSILDMILAALCCDT
jgi:hypothetical protein